MDAGSVGLRVIQQHQAATASGMDRNGMGPNVPEASAIGRAAYNTTVNIRTEGQMQDDPNHGSWGGNAANDDRSNFDMHSNHNSRRTRRGSKSGSSINSSRGTPSECLRSKLGDNDARDENGKVMKRTHEGFW